MSKTPKTDKIGYHGNQAEFLIFVAIFVVYLMKEEIEPSLRKICFFSVSRSLCNQFDPFADGLLIEQNHRTEFSLNGSNNI